MTTKIYSVTTLRELEIGLDTTFTGDGLVDLTILANTTRISTARVAYLIYNVGQELSNPTAMLGKRHDYTQQGKKGELVGVVESVNSAKEEKDTYLTEAQTLFEQLDIETNRIGYAGLAYVSHVINSFVRRGFDNRQSPDLESVLKQIKEYIPTIALSEPVQEYPAEYNNFISRIDSSSLSLEQISLLKGLLGLEHACYYLITSLKPEKLIEAKGSSEIPDSDLTNMCSAFDAYKNAIAVVKCRLHELYPELVSEMDTSRLHKLVQGYIEHEQSPWFKRFVFGSGINTGIASIIVGTYQLVHWIETGTIDPWWSPQILAYLPTFLLLLMTSSVVGAGMYSVLTFGSDVGRDVVNALYGKYLENTMEI